MLPELEHIASMDDLDTRWWGKGDCVTLVVMQPKTKNYYIPTPPYNNPDGLVGETCIGKQPSLVLTNGPTTLTGPGDTREEPLTWKGAEQCLGLIA